MGNPYQFSHKHFYSDRKALWQFFTVKGGSGWKDWYEKTAFAQGRGVRVTIFDTLYWFVFIAMWYTAVQAKLHMYSTLFPGMAQQLLPMLPPFIVSFVITGIASPLEPCWGRRYSENPKAAP